MVDVEVLFAEETATSAAVRTAQRGSRCLHRREAGSSEIEFSMIHPPRIEGVLLRTLVKARDLATLKSLVAGERDRSQG